MSRFLSAFYLTNLLTILSYPTLRTLGYTANHLSQSAYGIDSMPSKEMHVLICLLLVIFVRFFKSGNVDVFIGQSLFYSKVAILLISLATSWKLFVGYFVVMGIVWVLFPLGRYKGPSQMVYLSEEAFRRRVLGRDGSVWLVVFGTAWASDCTLLQPLFAQLSVEYADTGIQFGKVDLTRDVSIAPEMQISTDTTTKQLPTLILFKNGQELDRLPRINPDLTVEKTNFSKKTILSRFDLKSTPPVYMQDKLKQD